MLLILNVLNIDALSCIKHLAQDIALISWKADGILHSASDDLAVNLIFKSVVEIDGAAFNINHVRKHFN